MRDRPALPDSGRVRSAGKQVQRLLVAAAATEFRDGRSEFPIGRDRTEQRHRRSEFQVVGTAEYLGESVTLDGVDERRALSKPRSQNAMPEIGYRLLASGDGKSPGHRAVAEAGKLRENEPHPVTLLM